MRRKVSTTLLIVFISIITFGLSACNRRHNNDGITENDNQQGTPIQGSQELTHAQDREVFTISTPFGNLSRIEESADAFRQTLANQDIDIQMNVISYMQDEWQDQQSLLLSKFAAGVGPDIFLRDNLLLYPFIENGFLADIFTVIDQSTNFSRNDFFSNVLDGIAVNGNLYMLPLQFSMDYIGINPNIPQPFINRFEALDRATPTDIATLYLDLIAEHPEWADFALIHGFNATQALAPEFNNAVNFAGRTANFANIEFLETLRMAFDGNQRFETPPFGWGITAEEFEVVQVHYAFSRISGVFSGIYGLFNFQDPVFINYIPLADESGRLVNRAWGMEMVVNHTANPDFVMGFITQVISDDAAEDFRLGSNIPIMPRYLQHVVETSFRSTLTQIEILPLMDNETFTIEQAITRIEEYSTWPSNTMIANYLFSPWSFMEIFSEFLESDMPADEAASQIESAIIEWLNETRPEIEPFVYAPALTLPNLPARTLTVRSDNRHTGVFQQAADRINAAWLERGENYIFEVIVEDHSWTNWEDMDSRATTLRMELMSGQGPDIFLLTNYHEIHALVASGFLQDIYTLMDADPNTNRDEFFTQALAAFELNNGLFTLPTSFGFEYVAVNANLPQEFLNRFNQKSTISLTQMMEFYLDLKDTHPEEFGHLTFNTGSGISSSHNVLQTALAAFIDFNARTTDITNPRFIEALELMGRVYANWDLDSSWGLSISEPEFLRDRAEEYVFYAINQGVVSFDAFFTADPPIFKNHIPLVNDRGYLILDTPGEHGQVWSAICVTSVADGALAWEFIREVLYAYVNPVGRAAVEPVFGSANRWGRESLASPIERVHYREHLLRTFEATYDRFYDHMQTFVGFDDPANRQRQFEAAVDRISSYNQQPMSLLTPMIPQHLFAEHFDQFKRGLISAETAAQRIDNAISLWLIE